MLLAERLRNVSQVSYIMNIMKFLFKLLICIQNVLDIVKYPKKFMHVLWSPKIRPLKGIVSRILSREGVRYTLNIMMNSRLKPWMLLHVCYPRHVCCLHPRFLPLRAPGCSPCAACSHMLQPAAVVELLAAVTATAALRYAATAALLVCCCLLRCFATNKNWLLLQQPKTLEICYGFAAVAATKNPRPTF